MGNLISSISNTDSPVLIVLFSIGLTFIIVKELFASGKWIKDRLDGYHNIKNKEEDKEENIENRIKTLEAHDSWQYKKLNEVGEEVKQVISMLTKVQETQQKTIVDTYKGSIFRIYHDTTRQGSITQAELDRFIEIVHIYQSAGGDGIVDEKIYPEVMALPIRPEKDNSVTTHNKE